MTRMGISVIGDSVLFKTDVIRDFLLDREKMGNVIGDSLVGNNVIVSNDLPLSTNTIVVSTVAREGFEIIDLDDEDTMVHYVNKIWNKKITRPTLKKYQSTTIDGVYSNLIVGSENDNKFSYSRSINAFVHFIARPTLESIPIQNSLVPFMVYTSIVTSLVKGEMSMLWVSSKELTKTEEYNKNLIKISSAFLNSKNIEEVMLRMAVL